MSSDQRGVLVGVTTSLAVLVVCVAVGLSIMSICCWRRRKNRDPERNSRKYWRQEVQEEREEGMMMARARAPSEGFCSSRSPLVMRRNSLPVMRRNSLPDLTREAYLGRESWHSRLGLYGGFYEHDEDPSYPPSPNVSTPNVSSYDESEGTRDIFVEAGNRSGITEKVLPIRRVFHPLEPPRKEPIMNMEDQVAEERDIRHLDDHTLESESRSMLFPFIACEAKLQWYYIMFISECMYNIPLLFR